MSLRSLVAALLGSLLGGLLHANAGETKGLSLADAQRRAAEYNADLVTARAQVDAAIAQLRASREFPNPTLSLSTARLNTDHRGNGTVAGNRFLDRSYDSIVSLSQWFEIGKRGPRQDSARAGRRAAEAQRDDVRRLLGKAVAQAYVAAVEADEERRVLADSAASLRREADLASIRLAAGDIAATDKAQIEITAAQRELDAGAARHAATAAIITLELLLGEPTPRGSLSLADSLASLATLPLPSAEGSPAAARPDIAAAEASLAKAEADLLTQRRGVIPDVTLSAQFEHNPPDSPSSAGFGVSLPLPLWNHNRGAIGGARAARTQAQAQLAKARAQAGGEVAAAQSAYREARARNDAYSHELTGKSAEVVKAVAYSYAHGGAALVELLTAERNDNDLRLAAARAQADAASAAFALSAAFNQIGAGAAAGSAP